MNVLWHYKKPLFEALCGDLDDEHFLTTDAKLVNCPKCLEELKAKAEVDELLAGARGMDRGDGSGPVDDWFFPDDEPVPEQPFHPNEFDGDSD
jgi:hypothetical protein